MKKITLIILTLAFGFGVFSQVEPNYGDNKDECLKQVSLYSGYLQQKAYKDAYRFWKEAVKICPEYKPNLYDNGVYILKQLASDASLTKEQKKIHKDSIRLVYEACEKIFGSTPDRLEDYGNDLIVYAGEYEKGVEALDKAIEGLQEKTKYSTIIYYSKAMVKLIAREKQDCEAGVKSYEKLSGIIEKNQGKSGYDKAQETLDETLGACLTCDKLVPVMEKKFETAKTDAAVRSKVLGLMESRQCTDNDMYPVLVKIEIESKDNPTSEDYLKLADIKLNAKETNESLKFIDKAVELATDKKEKEKILEKAAQIALSAGSISKANKYASELLEINPNNGTAYIVKANAAARSSCGATAFDKSTKYWVAYDLAAKAKSLDESVASQASRLMGSYKSRFPAESELFAQGLTKGASYSHCSGASTTVRAQ